MNEPDGLPAMNGEAGAPPPDVKDGWMQLSEEEEVFLRAIVTGIDESERSERTQELRECREKREAWNCRLHLAYNEETGAFEDAVAVLVEEEDVDEDDLPSHYTDPFYLSYGLDATAIIGTVPFKTKFWAADPDDPKDQVAAQSATSLVAYFRKQNDDGRLRFKQGYLLYNDGGFALHTSYRPDAQKFGTRLEDVYEEQEIELLPAHVRCPQCGTTTSKGQEIALPEGPCPECASPDAEGSSCPDCGALFEGGCPGCGTRFEMGSWSAPVKATVPAPTKTIEVPNAGPIYEAHGWLEVRRPVAADRIEDCQWIQLSLEIHRALALSAFRWKEKEIRTSGPADSGMAREERFARESTSVSTNSGDERQHLVTFRRVWLRPEMFWEGEKPEIRDRVTKKFKNGVLLGFVNDVLVGAKQENLLDHWQLSVAYPGLGASRPSIGTPVLHLQHPHNELFNLRIDGLKAGIPSLLADPSVVNVDAMNKQRLKPNAWYPAERLHGEQSLASSVYATPTPNLPNDLFRIQDLLPGQRAQHASGIPAVAWGGQMGGAGETYAGYALMREQGLQRMRIPLGSMKAANEGADLQAVKLFRKWHQDDVVIAKEGPAGTVQNDRITVDELDGEIQIRSDQDLPIPATQTEKVERFFRAIKEDGLRDLLVHSGNEGFMRAALGDDTIKFPGQAERDHQRLEIDKLLKGERVQVNPLLDGHDFHLEEISLWWASPDAEAERKAGNPALAGVMEHYMDHLTAKAERDQLMASMAAMSQMPPPGVPMGPPGAQGPPGPPPGAGAPA